MLRIRDVDGILPLAFAALLLSYIESVSAARTFAAKYGYKLDARQELLGIGSANLLVAFGHGYPVAGGLSESAVNEKAGGQNSFVAYLRVDNARVLFALFHRILEKLTQGCACCLAAKNAILIVEFFEAEYDKGRPIVDAALAGARLRLRPILMTAFAFILGCVPLWLAAGSGAASRQILGTTVIGGMLAATFVAIFLISVRRTALGQRRTRRLPARRRESQVFPCRSSRSLSWLFLV
jgi:AcrB/AcrD/AcrF family/Sulfate permease family